VGVHHQNSYKPNQLIKTMEKEIGKIPKGEFQGTATEIVVGLKEYNGRTGVDIREFTKSETYTGPTKKGLRIPADKFDEFKKMINSINPADLNPQSKKPTPQPTTDDQKPTTSKKPTIDDEDAGIDEDGLM